MEILRRQAPFYFAAFMGVIASVGFWKILSGRKNQA